MEAKHLASEWQNSRSVGLRFFAALRMTATIWDPDQIKSKLDVGYFN